MDSFRVQRIGLFFSIQDSSTFLEFNRINYFFSFQDQMYYRQRKIQKGDSGGGQKLSQRQVKPRAVAWKQADHYTAFSDKPEEEFLQHKIKQNKRWINRSEIKWRQESCWYSYTLHETADWLLQLTSCTELLQCNGFILMQGLRERFD